jgi:putative selenium metabolism protein SsnA
MLLIGPGTIITFGEKNRVIPGGGVLIEDAVIKDVGFFATLKKEHPEAKILDAENRVILPGLINAHMHFYSSFARGMASTAAPATNFVEILERLWWRLDKALGPEDCYLSAIIPIIQGIKQGVTTFLDHHASPFYREGTPLGCLDEVSQAVIDTGVRASLCYEVSDRDGETIALAGISENERFIEMCRDGHGGGRLAGMIGLHAQFTIGDETLEAARQLNDYQKTGFHIHVAEDAADVVDAQKRGFRGAVDRLREFGILGEQSILAHCIHISEEETAMIAESGTAVVHLPTSNMNNGVGAAGIVGLREKGFTLGVGTDGMSPNVWEDLRAASWMARHRSGDPRQGWVESLELLVKGNPTIASRCFDTPVGIIEPGAAADVAVMDYWPPTPLADASTLGHLLFGLSHASAWHTVCHGQVLLEAKRLKIKIDEERIAMTASEHAEALWERIQ